MALALSENFEDEPTGARLRFERHLLEAIFRESPAAMALWRGEDMIFEMVNPRYQALFPGRDLLGKSFLEALPELAGQGFLEIFRTVLETGEPFRGQEVLARHRSSMDSPLEDRYYNVTYVRLLDLNGEPFGVYDHAIDVTPRVLARKAAEEAQERLRRSVAELERERDSREQFVATLSHDLRTPLTAAKMMAQLAARQADRPDQVRKLALRIDDNLNRADHMIRDLLDVGRVRAGEPLSLKFEPCDLVEVVGGAVREMSAIFGDRIVMRGEPRVPGVWGCDAIRRIVENLCSNAFKYGAIAAKVTVTVAVTEGNAILSVHNEGDPIPAPEQKRLFELYRRGGGTVTAQSWGLGLALVKGLVEAHGGNVAVESGAGRGTTFRVELPCQASFDGHLS